MPHQINKERIVIDLIILFGIFLLPSYISLIIAFLFAIKYRNYFEFPVFSFLIDVTYNQNKSVYLGLVGLSIIAVFAIEFLRDRVKAKKKDTLY